MNIRYELYEYSTELVDAVEDYLKRNRYPGHINRRLCTEGTRKKLLSGDPLSSSLDIIEFVFHLRFEELPLWMFTGRDLLNDLIKLRLQYGE